MVKRMRVHKQRRRISWIMGVAVLALGASLATSAAAGASSATAVVSATPGNQAAHIAAIVQKAMKADHLNAAIFRVTVDGKPVVTGAFGTSMTGVPATTAMHFRNGSVAFSYLTTLLMKFVDEHKISLNDKVARWLPTLPEAKLVTVKMLANMTSGYPDYVTDPKFIAEFYQNPFHEFTNAELLAIAFSQPVSFRPGTNWGYAHTNMVILGQILQMTGGKPLATLLRQNVLGPLGLTNTVASSTAAIPNPVLHAFSSERRDALGIPPATPFYEESTYWNPAWSYACWLDRDDQHLRYDRHSPGHRQRRSAVQVELPSADRPEPARLRARTVRVRLRPADDQLQLRARHRPHRLMARGDPQLRRLRSSRGLPTV